MKIGIVGYGHVGKAMHKLFPQAVVVDEPLAIGSREEARGCDVLFVCVPTPSQADGSCDVSIVDDVLGWIEADVVVLRSTVPVGYTDEAKERTGKRIVFQPEYYGETPAHPFADPRARPWLTLGGDRRDAEIVARAYKSIFSADVKFVFTDAKTAELAKYMENSFLALKVTFCNEFYDIARSMGVSYDELREVWLEDPRISRSHTFVYEDDRGYGGKCLPKDVDALIAFSADSGVDAELMKAVRAKNDKLRNGTGEGKGKRAHPTI